MQHRYIEVAGGVRLHIAEEGDPAGRLVVLLHGFPDFWYLWHRQIAGLVEAGFHVAAPDLRGYNLSGKPRDVPAYRVDAVARDIAGLIGALGSERAIVAGHDWGGAVAWQLAAQHPEAVERLIVLNSPHPERFARAARRPRQLARSSYMLFFQIPWLPERLLSAGNFTLLRRGLRQQMVRSDAFTGEHIARNLAAWSRPGALRGGLNYYRAAARTNPREWLRSLRRIDQPVLVIWGQRDRFLLPDLAEPNPRYVPHARVERIDNAGHWVMIDAPDRVTRLIATFGGSETGTTGYRGPEDLPTA